MMFALAMMIQLASTDAASPPPDVKVWQAKDFGEPTPTDFYPEDAKRAGIEGVVTIGLTIDAKGRPAECWVVESSNWKSLDVASCRVAIWRWKFDVRKDAQGNAIAYRVAEHFRWRLHDR